MSPYFAKDKRHVWHVSSSFFSVLSPTADPNTFELLPSDMGADKNNIYRSSGDVWVGVDRASYEHLGFEYSKDKNHAYIWTREIEHVDLDTFEALSRYYAKDKNNVYCEYNIIKDGDPDSFVITSDQRAYDKNGEIYFCARATR